MTKETLKSNGYKYVMFDNDGNHVLYEISSGNFERWGSSKNHAGHSMKYKNTDLEFCSSYNEYERDRLIAYMLKIQRWGEQHELSHSTMMNVYRKYIAK